MTKNTKMKKIEGKVYAFIDASNVYYAALHEGWLDEFDHFVREKIGIER